MPDPAPGAVTLPPQPAPAAATAAPKSAASPAPAQPAQPSPAAASRPGAPGQTPAPAQPAAPSMVPVSALHEEREKRQALQAELETLKTTVSQLAQGRSPAAPGFGPQAQPQPDPRAQLEKLWQDDPRRAVQTEIMMATQWMDNVNAQVDGEAEQLTTKYTDFNDYRNTTMRYVRALPLDQRSRPGIVEMAYLVSRGQNVDKILEAQRAAMAAQFQQNPAAFQMPAGASAGSSAPQNTQATDAEVRAAGAMKVPIEEYLKWKK